uniref:Uncharacterized protein n=1 Tax=Glossina palpalis gambiensis TaxID=67801 RepID=A0A1B0BQ36_9MUSC
MDKPVKPYQKSEAGLRLSTSSKLDRLYNRSLPLENEISTNNTFYCSRAARKTLSCRLERESIRRCVRLIRFFGVDGGLEVSAINLPLGVVSICNCWSFCAGDSFKVSNGSSRVEDDDDDNDDDNDDEFSEMYRIFAITFSMGCVTVMLVMVLIEMLCWHVLPISQEMSHRGRYFDDDVVAVAAVAAVVAVTADLGYCCVTACVLVGTRSNCKTGDAGEYFCSLNDSSEDTFISVRLRRSIILLRSRLLELVLVSTGDEPVLRALINHPSGLCLSFGLKSFIFISFVLFIFHVLQFLICEVNIYAITKTYWK